jgi:hydroxymethylpyrimidine/phosphomethylpyrimidine kinase
VNTSPPVVLTIAGSDNSAGAGVQADLKTFFAHGVYGLTAITCVVAEVPGVVSAIAPVPAEVVAKQIELCLAHYPVAAIKTGLLCSREIVEVVAAFFSRHEIPIVIDPVMIATSGDLLLAVEAIEIYQTKLFHGATLVTPNLDEAGALLGRPVREIDEMRVAGRDLEARFGCPFLLKGGHLKGKDATDLLFWNHQVEEFSAPFVAGIQSHGTGCTYSAAIVAGLALGFSLDSAIRKAKDYVTRAITGHFRWNEIDALNHHASEAS